MNINEEKQKLRETIKGKLRTFTNDKARVKCESFAIAKRVFSLDAYKNASAVFAFVSTKSEVQTDEIIAQTLKEKKRTAIPRIKQGAQHKNEMDFFLLNENAPLAKQVHTGAFGIREPNDDLKKTGIVKESEQNKCTLVLFPGLAFSKKGVRLGKGKAFYDNYFSPNAALSKDARFFSEKKIVRCGLCFSFQIFDFIPSEEHDITMDFVVTEKEILVCD